MKPTPPLGCDIRTSSACMTAASLRDNCDQRPDLATLDDVLAKAMAKDPAARFGRCTDFARALSETARPKGRVPSVPAPDLPRSPAASALSKSGTVTPSLLPPPLRGWYSERDGPGQRFLDGADWTAHRRADRRKSRLDERRARGSG